MNWISKPKEVLLAWWIVGIWAAFFTLVSLGTATVTALYGMRWREMDSQDHFIVCVLIFVNWGNVMMAFLYRAVSRLQKGEMPIEETTVTASATVTTEKTEKHEIPPTPDR